MDKASLKLTKPLNNPRLINRPFSRTSSQVRLSEIENGEEPRTHLIGSTEERLPSVHLHQDAPQRPHVNRKVIRHSQQHLWRPIKATLNVLVYLKQNSVTV